MNKYDSNSFDFVGALNLVVPYVGFLIIAFILVFSYKKLKDFASLKAINSSKKSKANFKKTNVPLLIKKAEILEGKLNSNSKIISSEGEYSPLVKKFMGFLEMRVVKEILPELQHRFLDFAVIRMPLERQNQQNEEVFLNKKHEKKEVQLIPPQVEGSGPSNNPKTSTRPTQLFSSGARATGNFSEENIFLEESIKKELPVEKIEEFMVSVVIDKLKELQNISKSRGVEIKSLEEIADFSKNKLTNLQQLFNVANESNKEAEKPNSSPKNAIAIRFFSQMMNHQEKLPSVEFLEKILNNIESGVKVASSWQDRSYLQKSSQENYLNSSKERVAR